MEKAFQKFQNTSKSSNDNSNVVNAPREPFVVKQDPSVNSSQKSPLIDQKCCCECGDSLDGIFCQQCTLLKSLSQSLSESKGVPKVCDVPFHDNSPPLDISKDQSEDFSDSNVDSTSTDEDSFSSNDVEYVGGSPPNLSQLARSDGDCYSEVGRLSFLHDNDHFKEKSSGSTTTHVDFSQYDSFIFDLSNDQFPPTDRSDFYHEEFADGLAQIISPPEYDRFCFKIEPELGNLTMDVVGNIFQESEPRVHDSRIVRLSVCHSSRVSHRRFNSGIRYPNLSLTLLPRSGYHQKDRKPSQNDKTEHGMVKTVQNQGQKSKMSKSAVKPEPELMEYYWMQSLPV
ncbi:hypothetical protein Tco_1107253 [Tanacetum coccineum]